MILNIKWTCLGNVIIPIIRDACNLAQIKLWQSHSINCTQVKEPPESPLEPETWNKTLPGESGDMGWSFPGSDTQESCRGRDHKIKIMKIQRRTGKSIGKKGNWVLAEGSRNCNAGNGFCSAKRFAASKLWWIEPGNALWWKTRPRGKFGSLPFLSLKI